MRRKRIMVIGPARSGKTTICNALNGIEGDARRTQDVIYGKGTIDVPGAYIENSWMYKHLIALAQDASHVLVLVDQTNPAGIYPPGFVKVFGCPVTGVITKSDLKLENEAICIKQLKQAGVCEPIFRILVDGSTGIVELKEHLSLQE